MKVIGRPLHHIKGEKVSCWSVKDVGSTGLERSKLAYSVQLPHARTSPSWKKVIAVLGLWSMHSHLGNGRDNQRPIRGMRPKPTVVCGRWLKSKLALRATFSPISSNFRDRLVGGEWCLDQWPVCNNGLNCEQNLVQFSYKNDKSPL